MFLSHKFSAHKHENQMTPFKEFRALDRTISNGHYVKFLIDQMLLGIQECPIQEQDLEKQLFPTRQLKCEYQSTLTASDFRLLNEFLEKTGIETKLGGTYKVRSITIPLSKDDLIKSFEKAMEKCYPDIYDSLYRSDDTPSC